MALIRDEIINQRLEKVFQDVFDDDRIKLFDTMNAADIDEWDSLMHITLVVAIEKEFGVHLNAAEVGELKNVGEMLRLLENKATR